MPLIDSHAHLDFYHADLDDVLTRAREAGIETILSIGIGEGPDTMHHALEIANHQGNGSPRLFASVGIHPQEAAQATPEALANMATLATNPKCIAIGEIGLDYYHADNPLPPVQHAAFIAQMKLAADAGKPILIHCRTSELATADRILVETDAPFLAPIPHRGQQNEPALVVHTAAALAALRNISPEELATITTQNFRKLFPTTT